MSVVVLLLIVLLSFNNASGARLLITAKDSNTFVNQFRKEINAATVGSLKAAQLTSVKGFLVCENNGIRSAQKAEGLEDKKYNLETKKSKLGAAQNQALVDLEVSTTVKHPGFDVDYEGPKTHPPSHN